ncbi:MAG TPA: hypothetical protein VHZ24_10610 [Pirellulales bacterium]|jgi:hypothetical protein|nr:hypothetical protein [Pirellulales bacterium]
MSSLECSEIAPSMLAGRRVLLVCPQTFDYHRLLRDELGLHGAQVDCFTENLENTAYAIARRLGSRGLSAYKDFFRRTVARQAAQVEYDFILVVRGEFLNRAWLEWLRAAQPQARMVMYQWDPVRIHDFRPVIDVFDRVASFDRADCEQYGLDYLPLFFCRDLDRLRDGGDEPRWDLTFVGTLHSDRTRIALDLAEQAAAAGLSTFLFFYLTWTSYTKQAWIQRTIPRRVPHLSLRPMPRSRLLEIIGRSRAVIDVNKPEQTGLTMRTMEVLGAGRKLITTNEHVRMEPFYSPEVVDVVDRDAPALDTDFVVASHAPADVHRQRLDRWLLDLLGDRAA